MQKAELHSTHYLLSISYSMMYLVKVYKDDSLYSLTAALK
jgi:hypothetical protein